MIVGLALVALASACGDDAPAPAERGAVLAVRGPDGPVATYVALVATGDEAAPTARSCTAATCEAGALALGELAAPTHVVVKAQGFERQAADLAAGAEGTTTLALVPVPAPVATADYTTGFAADATGEDALVDLAVQFPSELGRALVIKFYVDDLRAVRGPPTVYFQDTAAHPLHYDFYRDVLGRPGTRKEFADATYVGQERGAAAGTLVFYPDVAAPVARPVTMTFFPSDDLGPALALRIQALVEARMPFLDRAGGASGLVYLPAGEVQEQAARGAAASFSRAGAAWVTHADLYGAIDEQRLNTGVAFGTLRRMSPEELATAVVSFQDVLVLTRLPNDLPIVGGTITEELQTPLAHVNVAARARGTPNLALLGAGARAEIAPLIGQLVRFEVTTTGWSLRAATLAEAEAFWDSRAPEPWTPPADTTTAGLPEFAELGFDDAVAIGVKAANLAELHHLLPEVAPDGFAVPFHYYDDFMATTVFGAASCDGARADCLDEGRAADVCTAVHARCVPPGGGAETLAAYVERLLADATFRSDSVQREASLDGLRWLIRHRAVDAAFGAALDARVAERFGSSLEVRLRSSTNAEDLPEFSGAGLYDSYGAYATGKDRASEEIRKVWASVWNWRAFEERAFWGIDHRAVKMGVAVHPAFPDEQVNGVLLTVNLADPTVAGFYVNAQKGEVSVTNPADGAVPEVFSIVEAPGGGVQVIRQRFSSLSPGVPLMTDAEVLALYLASFEVQRHFAALYDVPPYDFALDLEFKLHGPERALVIKQARPYHDPSGASP